MSCIPVALYGPAADFKKFWWQFFDEYMGKDLNHFELPNIVEKKVQREHDQNQRENEKPNQNNTWAAHIITLQIFKISQQFHISIPTLHCQPLSIIAYFPTHNATKDSQANASHKPRAADMVLPTPSHSQDTANWRDMSEPQPKSKKLLNAPVVNMPMPQAVILEANPTKKKKEDHRA